MDIILDFLADNWYYIVVIILSFLSVLLALVKKKRVINTDLFTDALKNTILKLPEIIKNVESLEIAGSDKKSLVIASAIKFISGLLGRDLTDDEDKYLSNIFSIQIESVLDAPTKNK